VPVIAILSGKSQFKFRLKSGSSTDLYSFSEFTEMKFDPDVVRSVVLWWSEEEGRLHAI
jgi:hypothetical protein